MLQLFPYLIPGVLIDYFLCLIEPMLYRLRIVFSRYALLNF
ncbi:MAG: hypothetical protein OFPI_18300 [Osedax symbiont Rs2]|nr:MAG: hypothetical protein OFPI_18300 [Osedax symbiont Rs2]